MKEEIVETKKEDEIVEEKEIDEMADDIKRSMFESYLNDMFDAGVDRVNSAIEGLPNWVAVAILELIKADIVNIKD